MYKRRKRAELQGVVTAETARDVADVDFSSRHCALQDCVVLALEYHELGLCL